MSCPRGVNFGRRLGVNIQRRLTVRDSAVLRGHRETIGERFGRDREKLTALPPAPFEACDKVGTRVSSLSLVRYRGNDYSVPVAYGHQEVWVRGYVHDVVIGCGAPIDMKLGMLPRRSSSVCIFTAALVVRKCAHGKTDRHRAMVVESRA